MLSQRKSITTVKCVVYNDVMNSITVDGCDNDDGKISYGVTCGVMFSVFLT